MRFTWLVSFTLCLTLVSALPVMAGEESRVEPDRPDLTDSASTVPRRAFQIETGLEYARTKVESEAERRFALQAMLRAGLTDRLELRLQGEPLVRLRGAEDATDHGDLTIGLKYRLLDSQKEQGWPSFGLLPFMKLPLADAPIGSERFDFGLVGLASLELPWQLGLDLNAGLVLAGQSKPNGYLVQGIVSASLSREITEQMSAFVELFFFSREQRDKKETVGLDTGIVYLLTKRIALDAAAEASHAGRGLSFALRSGVSLRFGQ